MSPLEKHQGLGPPHSRLEGEHRPYRHNPQRDPGDLGMGLGSAALPGGSSLPLLHWMMDP
ncbi:hypothetical protein [Arthrobacter methylotrophus]|uniref:hypothetical protein n=1 Tax=Arthrobacter methylotrophus TaxID=121291 RepID=UPI0031E657AA